MTAAKRHSLVAVEDYLAGELVSPVKHEYVAGVVYAMAGARNVHNRIASNLLGRLHALLRKRRCQPYNSDTKVRIRMPTHLRFYYPDVMVVCHENPPDDSFQDQPALIAEVLSPSTRRIDEGEKKDAYLTIGALSLYLLVEPSEPAVVVFRRTEQGFVREVYEGIQAVIPMPEIGTQLPLEELYEGVEFIPERDEDPEA